MKKLIPYISILVILIGLSSPVIPVLAYTNGPTAGVCLEKNVPSGRQPATAAEIAAGVNLVDVPNANGVGTTKYKYDIVTAYASSYEQQCHDTTQGAFLSWTPIVCTNSANTVPIGCVPPAGYLSPGNNNGPCDYSTPGDVPGDPSTADNQPCTNTTYGLLAPLPGTDGTTLDRINVAGDNALGDYLNVILKLAIGLAAVLAMVMIVMGGIEYMTSELVSSKEEGKHRITNAVFGLMIALSAWLILYTINPDLLNTNIKIASTTIDFTQEPETGISQKTISVGGTQITACDESVLTTVSVFGSSVQVNKGVAASLQRIDAKWQKMSPQYKVTSIGGYNCRSVTNKPGVWSAHAYGLAVDINPGTNPYSATGPVKTDIPLEFRQLFLDEGWGWGGNWGSPVDPMHFSKYPSQEGGDGVLQ